MSSPTAEQWALLKVWLESNHFPLKFKPDFDKDEIEKATNMTIDQVMDEFTKSQQQQQPAAEPPATASVAAAAASSSACKEVVVVHDFVEPDPEPDSGDELDQAANDKMDPAWKKLDAASCAAARSWLGLQ